MPPKSVRSAWSRTENFKNNPKHPLGVCGVYKITNAFNGKIYIGASVNIQNRVYQYRSDLGESCTRLHRSIAKYGIRNHEFDIIELCSKENLYHREAYFIDLHQTVKNGYNCKTGGESQFKLSPSTIKRMRKAQEGIKCDAYRVSDRSFIGTFASAHDAKRTTGVMIGGVCAVLSGLSHHAKGIHFCKAGTTPDWDTLEKLMAPKKKKPLDVYEVKSQKFVGRFESRYSIYKTLSIQQGNILSVLRGVRKSASGYTFTPAGTEIDWNVFLNSGINLRTRKIKSEHMAYFASNT